MEWDIKERCYGVIVDSIIVLYGKLYNDDGDGVNGNVVFVGGDDIVGVDGGDEDGDDNEDSDGGVVVFDDDYGDGGDDVDDGINNSYCLLSFVVCLVLCKRFYVFDGI